MKKETKTTKKYGATPQSMKANEPSMFFDPFTWTGAGAGAAVAALKLGGEWGAALLSKIKKDDRLVFQIIDSTLVNDEHAVTLQVTNITGDGIYLESLSLKEPKNVELRIWILKGSMSVGRDAIEGFYALDSYLPRLIKGAESLTLKLRFLKQDPEGKKYVTFQCAFSELGETKLVEGHKFESRIRWAAEPSVDAWIRREKSTS